MVEYREAGLPFRPTIDRLIAYYLFCKTVCGGRFLKIRFMNQETDLTKSELAALADEGVYLIGVSGNSYRAQNMGSETSLMVSDLRKAGALSGENPALDEISRLMDSNNQHGGLVHQSLSLNWAGRQGYRFANNPAELIVDDDDHVVRSLLHVINAYLVLAEGGVRTLRIPKQAEECEVFKILQRYGQKNFGPFSVGRYMRDLLVLGAPEERVSERASWFLRIYDRAKERQKAAENFVNRTAFDTFPIGQRMQRGTWVETTDPWVSEQVAKRRHLAVIRNPETGNVIAFSRDFSLANAATALLKREPKLWHYEPEPRNILANGTESVHTYATGEPRPELEGIIGSRATPREKK